jgi:hypothetical protein
MSEDFQTSEATDKLDAAMAKAQSQIQSARKDSINPHFRSKFADLGSCWEACRDALASNGISITQWPVAGGPGALFMVTRLAKDGQWIKSRSEWPVTKDDCQGRGSALTYARRYTLCAAVGVVADEDDDGNAASRSKPRQTERVDSQGEIHPATPTAQYKSFITRLDEKVKAKVLTKEPAWKAAMTFAHQLGYDHAKLQACSDPSVFTAIFDKLLAPTHPRNGNVVKQPVTSDF